MTKTERLRVLWLIDFVDDAMAASGERAFCRKGNATVAMLRRWLAADDAKRGAAFQHGDRVRRRSGEPVGVGTITSKPRVGSQIAHVQGPGGWAGWCRLDELEVVDEEAEHQARKEAAIDDILAGRNPMTRRRRRKKLTEAEWSVVFKLRCRSKRGEPITVEERRLVDAAYVDDRARYSTMDADVFDATVPFGSKVRYPRGGRRKT